MASGSEDNTIKIWNTDDGSVVRTLTGHNADIFSLAVLPNGNLASGSGDTTIKIWNTDEGLIRTLTGHTDAIKALAVLQNGYLASASNDTTIKIWNTDNQSLINTFSGYNTYGNSLAALENGRFATVGLDDTIKIFDPNYGLIRNISYSFKSFALQGLPNSQIAIGGWKEIKIFNTDDGSLIRTLEGHKFPVLFLKYLPNGNLVSGDNSGKINNWNLNEGSSKKTSNTGSSSNAFTILPGKAASTNNNTGIIIIEFRF